MDTGVIKTIESNDKESAGIMCDMESLEEIENDEIIVKIYPYQSSTTHLIKLRDFIRFNMDKEKYTNPHNRNLLNFSDEDLLILQKAKDDEIELLKSLPNKVFTKLVDNLKLIIQHKIEMYYFPSIVHILNTLLGVIPFLNSMDEFLGSYEPEVNEMILGLQKDLEIGLEKISHDLESPETIGKVQLEEECLLIPDEIKKILCFVFERLVKIMETILECKKESEYSQKVLSVFLNLDTVRNIFENYGNLIVADSKKMENIDNVLIFISTKLYELEE